MKMTLEEIGAVLSAEKKSAPVDVLALRKGVDVVLSNSQSTHKTSTVHVLIPPGNALVVLPLSMLWERREVV